MRGRVLAHACYAIGSCVFLVSSLVRGSPLVLAGSSLFLAGTILLTVQEVRRARAGRPAGTGHRPGRGTWAAAPSGRAGRPCPSGSTCAVISPG
jgi:hypothetical protein